MAEHNKSILDKLVDNNEFPIIFIGSGISKRYLENYPSWEELLKSIWSEAKNPDTFYSYLNKEKRVIEEQNENDINFLLNTKVATELESEVNKAFDEQTFEIEGLTAEEAFKKSLSPFKRMVANKFKDYTLNSNASSELDSFKKMLLKAQVIFTTNYDEFIENTYDEASATPITKFIGQTGFFQHTPEYAEIYKIHGCVTNEKSLVITTDDYYTFDKNSVLISAKLISMLLHSPIIFLGYSLTDRNIRKILKDFSSSLSEREKHTLEKRLIVVEYEKEQKSVIEEIETDTDLGCRMTVLRTDNYSKIYDMISKIDQGVAPSEIRKYQHIIKNLIVERGKTGKLGTFLISPNELDDVDNAIKNQNIVLAIGDKATIFHAPTIVQYCFEYISENFDQNLDIMLRFIAAQGSNSRVPILRYLTTKNIKEAQISKVEKLKLVERLNRFSDIDNEISNIQTKTTFLSIPEIEDSLESSILKNKVEKMNQLIAYNIKELNLNDVKQYILKQLSLLVANKEATMKTQLRRLCLIYDLAKNGDNVDEDNPC